MRDGHRRGTSHADAFDQVAANLRQQWLDDGLGYAGDLWEGQPTLYKLTYLANFAAAMGVSFERYEEAARGVVGLGPGQQFTPEHEWFIAHEFQEATGKYASRRVLDEMRVNLNKMSLADLKADGRREQPTPQKTKDKEMER